MQRSAPLIPLLLFVLFSVQSNAATTKYPSYGSSLERYRQREQAPEKSLPNLAVGTPDSYFSVASMMKIDHFLQKNVETLNSNLPNTSEYFKGTFDLKFNFVGGEQTYGHKVLEAFLNLRHKGIWGRGAVFADADGTTPVKVKLSDTRFGEHKHQSGKPLVWINAGWMRVCLNDVFNNDNDKKHYIKLGWFPFSLGRGIALGSAYGLNREALGLYSYPEDKGAPGINIHGELIKNRLEYDLYYAKFEERGKAFGDTGALTKTYRVDLVIPWRGNGKDDDLFAARLQIKPSLPSGTLEIEPYIFFNEASDQTNEENFPGDTKTAFGSVGCMLEYAHGNFEVGGEVAANYGTERLYNIDRNLANIVREATTSPVLEEVFSKVIDTSIPVQDAGGNKNNRGAAVTAANKAIAAGMTSNGQVSGTLQNASDRFRPSYKNDLRGWMAVVDAAYTFHTVPLKIAAAYGYASGDANPNVVTKQFNKKYNGFIGLHEVYTGKRVQSIFWLDERLTMIPSAFTSNTDLEAFQDLSFSDLQHVGLSATWAPKEHHKKLSLNSNLLFFWKAFTGKKIILNTDGSVGVSSEDARTFMGTELNLIVKAELVKNLTGYIQAAVFFPGGYFKDISGITVSNDYFRFAADEAESMEDVNPRDFRLGYSTAYHLNIGLECKF